MEQNSTIFRTKIKVAELFLNTHIFQSIQGITEGIRDAMIHYIVYRWFEMTNPAEAALYLKHFEENITDIRYRSNQSNCFFINVNVILNDNPDTIWEKTQDYSDVSKEFLWITTDKNNRHMLSISRECTNLLYLSH